MAAELGVGVRVYVGWTHPKEVFCNGLNPTCQVGTILSGPEYDLIATDKEGHVKKFLQGAA